MFDESVELEVLRNEIEYLKRRVKELERVNLYKDANAMIPIAWPASFDSIVIKKETNE